MKRKTRAASPRKRAPKTTIPPPGQDVLYEVEAGAAWITLNRPRRGNALAGTMREELLALIKEAGSDPSVGCVVITGAGNCFCAGGDIDAMAARKDDGEDFEALGLLMDLGGRIVQALSALPKPSLASLPGDAAGAGCNLALACDFRIASRAARLGETFVRVGLHPDWGGTYLLPRLVGGGRALEMLATGMMVEADEALRLGLVSRVVPASKLRSETQALALRLGALPLQAFLAVREAVRRSLTASLPAMLTFERQAQRLCWESEDSAEGIRAFLEKRPPRFNLR